MGAATKHKQALLKTNPNCIFCGGAALATTVEHCPPRALFQNRQWPEGFEFAACHGCNGGTSNEDLLLSMLARMNPFDDSSDSDGKTEGIVRRVVKQFPGIFSRMELSAAEARRNNRKLGITPTPGQLHQEAGVVRVPPEMTNAVCTFSSKLAKAVYFLHSQRIFPVEGCLLLHWFTNVHLYEKGHYPMLKQMEHFDGLVPDLVRTGRHLNDQFSYKLTMDRTHEVFALQTVFGKAFGTVVFGSREPGKLEATFAELKRKFPNKPEPFSVLQSSVLPVTRTTPETAPYTAA